MKLACVYIALMAIALMGCGTPKSKSWPYRGWETNTTTVIVVTNIVYIDRIPEPHKYWTPGVMTTNGISHPIIVGPPVYVQTGSHP